MVEVSRRPIVPGGPRRWVLEKPTVTVSVTFVSGRVTVTSGRTSEVETDGISSRDDVVSTSVGQRTCPFFVCLGYLLKILF